MRLHIILKNFLQIPKKIRSGLYNHFLHNHFLYNHFLHNHFLRNFLLKKKNRKKRNDILSQKRKHLLSQILPSSKTVSKIPPNTSLPQNEITKRPQEDANTKNAASTSNILASNTLQAPAATPNIPVLNASYCAVLSPITQLPTKVFIHPIGQPETTIGWWLTVEMLNDLIGQFLNGFISRLAMSWGTRDLVLLHNKGRYDTILTPNSGTYACLFFDNNKSDWYALVSLPDVYAVVEEKDVVYVPFGLGMLPNYMVHDNTERIKHHLNEIVAMAANPQRSPAFMTWSPQVYRFETYPRYHIAKRLYGGYSAQQEPCRINAKFYIPVAPILLAYENCSKTQSNNAYKPRNKSETQEALVSYMMGKLSLLILTWQFEDYRKQENGSLLKRHIILVQDQGCHQMLYLDDSNQYLSYLVSNVHEYMEAEGNRYHKTIFRGETMPAYLVHKDLCRIRDYMDLLLAQIQEPHAVLNLFGEFSYDGSSYAQVVEAFFGKERI